MIYSSRGQRWLELEILRVPALTSFPRPCRNRGRHSIASAHGSCDAPPPPPYGHTLCCHSCSLAQDEANPRRRKRPVVSHGVENPHAQCESAVGPKRAQA